MVENKNNLATREEVQREYQTTCEELTATRQKINILRTRLQQANKKVEGLSARKQAIDRRLAELRYLQKK